MKRFLIVVIVLALLALGFVLYRSRFSANRLDVDPHARKEIEKARRR
jgi:Tfp pilus assembly protein PilX